ncbi:hypothetical protein MWU59_13160 [Flavobacteriaceae bacterium F08102]|nr:hypothetical protein [Flavobacteriaceae bacterium F08102]
MKNISIVVCLLFNVMLLGQTTINTMFYNLLDFPEAPPTHRANILKTILDSYEPDLFLVCELTSEEGANAILNTALARTDHRYKKASFISNQSNPNVDLQQLAFYNSQKLTLIDQAVITTHLRDINHYTFVLNTTDMDSSPVYLDAFVTHLKSSEGTNNQQQRLEMVQDFTTSLVSIPENHFVIFAGDLNLYSGQEPAYQELLDPTNAIELKDPLDENGVWHNTSNYTPIQTQATRLNPIGSHGAGGGIDDRFDFILLSQNFFSNAVLSYVDNSYQAYGNNGNCFNKAVNDPMCTGTFSQDLRNLLHDMSDHLPVTLQLISDKTLSIDKAPAISKAITFAHGNLIYENLEVVINPHYYGKKLVLYNILGEVLERKTITQERTYIDATSLQNGIYYISIPTSNTPPRKFIKL